LTPIAGLVVVGIALLLMVGSANLNTNAN
jgi:hypothetical protein